MGALLIGVGLGFGVQGLGFSGLGLSGLGFRSVYKGR